MASSHNGKYSGAVSYLVRMFGPEGSVLDKQFPSTVKSESQSDKQVFSTYETLDSIGDTNFLLAVRYEQIDRVVSILSRANRSDIRTEVLSMALFQAVKFKLDFQFVRKLVQLGATSNYRDGQGKNCLHVASEIGDHDVEYVKIFLEGLNLTCEDLNVADRSGNTALHLCQVSRNSKLILMLLSAGADINTKNHCGETALHEAAKRKNYESVKVLMENGANANLKDKRGKTAKMNAEGRANFLKLMNKRWGQKHHKKQKQAKQKKTSRSDAHMGASGDSKLKENCTWTQDQQMTLDAALFEAVRERNLNLVQVLLHYGAVPYNSGIGSTPLQVASNLGLIDIVAMLVSTENVNVKDHKFRTPLIGCQEGSSAACITQVLLSAGAHVDAQNDKGETSLLKAVEAMNVGALMKLVSKGADTNLKDKSGRSGTSIATSLGFEHLLLCFTQESLKYEENESPVVKAMEFMNIKMLHVVLASGYFNPSPALNLYLQKKKTALNRRFNQGFSDSLTDQEKKGVKILLNQGADIHHRLTEKLNEWAFTCPLIIAIECCDLNLVKLLLETLPSPEKCYKNEELYSVAVSAAVDEAKCEFLDVLEPVLKILRSKDHPTLNLEDAFEQGWPNYENNFDFLSRLFAMSECFDVVKMLFSFLASRQDDRDMGEDQYRPGPSPALSDEEFKVINLLISSDNFTVNNCSKYDLEDNDCTVKNPILLAVEMNDHRLLTLLMERNCFGRFRTVCAFNHATKLAAEIDLPEMIDFFGREQKKMTINQTSVDFETPLLVALKLDHRASIHKLLSFTKDFNLVSAIQVYLNTILHRILLSSVPEENRPKSLDEEQMKCLEALIEAGTSTSYESWELGGPFTVLEAALKLKDLRLFRFIQDKIPLDHLGTPESLARVTAIAANQDFNEILPIVSPVFTNKVSKPIAKHLDAALISAIKVNNETFAKGIIAMYPHFDLDFAVDIVLSYEHLHILETIASVASKQFSSKIDRVKGTDWLCAACNQDCFDIVEFLLKKGAKPNYDEDNTQPLMCSKSEDVTEILIKHGAGINRRNPAGSVLFVAVSVDDCHKVELLIKHGACVDLDVLNYVLLKCSVNMRQIILSHCKDEVACEESSTKMYPLSNAALAGDLVSVKTLVKKGAKVNYGTESCKPALVRAILKRATDVVEYLLDNGADASTRLDEDGMPLIALAVDNHCNAAMIPILVKHGADPNSCYLKMSLLSFSKDMDVYEVFQALIASGADINETITDGREVKSESFLSNLLFDIFHYVSDFSHLAKYAVLLFEKGAQLTSMSDIINSSAIQECIKNKEFPLMSALIRYGNLSPSLLSDKFKHTNGQTVTHIPYKLISPLCMALFAGYPSVAEDMLKAFYLTPSDLFILPHNDQFRTALSRRNIPEKCRDIFNEMGSSPPSLKMLSFVHVSDRLGSGLVRRENVAQLGLPPRIQKWLLFTATDQKIAEGLVIDDDDKDDDDDDDDDDYGGDDDDDDEYDIYQDSDGECYIHGGSMGYHQSLADAAVYFAMMNGDSDSEYGYDPYSFFDY